MDHFLKGICPVMRLYINLLLKKRIQINPEINDLFRIHQFSFFLVDKWAKNFTFCVRRCYAMPVCLISISCGLRSLEEEIHIESDYTVKQTIRTEFAVRAQQSPIQMKKQQEPIKPRKFHLSRDLLTDRTFYEGSLVLREKHMFTPLYLIFREGKYYYSLKQISS